MAAERIRPRYRVVIEGHGTLAVFASIVKAEEIAEGVREEYPDLVVEVQEMSLDVYTRPLRRGRE